MRERHFYNRESTGSPISLTRGKASILHRSRPNQTLRTAAAAFFVAAPLLACAAASNAAPAPKSSASAPTAVAAAPANAAPAGVRSPRLGISRAAAQDLRGVTLEYVPGEVRFDTLSVNGTAYSRISVMGATMVEPPGRPWLPTATLHVAIPDGMSPRVTIASQDWNERAGPAPPLPVAKQRFVSDDPKTGPVSEFTTTPDPGVYARAALYPAQAVEAGSGAAVGGMWVVPVYVHPVRWNPATRAFQILTHMTIRVDFAPASDAERAARPPLRPSADAGAWQRVQEGLVKNYQAARSFPVRSKPAPRPAARMRMFANPEYKLSVASTGWTSVSFSALSAAGFPSNIPIDQIIVSEKGYDDVGDTATVTPIPVVYRDNNSDGTFNAADLITFYARSLHDRVAGNLETRYSDTNVYWLSWANSAAPPIGTISGDISNPSPILPTSFYDTIHLEQDLLMLASPDPSSAAPSEAADIFYWTNGNIDSPDQVDETIPFVDPDTSQPFQIRAYYQGQNAYVHRLNITYVSSTSITDVLATDQTFFNQETFLLDTGLTIPGTHIGPGANHYKHVGDGMPLSGSTFFNGSKAWLDWIEVTYARQYKAENEVLQFTSGGQGGIRELHVTNFTYSNFEVYDVTNPVAPLRVTDVTTIPFSSGHPYFEAVFRTDASAGDRKFVAVTPNFENALPASAVTADVPSTLTVPGPYGSNNVARSIIITPRAFLTPATRLADYRRLQGYVVEVADVQDIYDEFNGGVKSARAIRRYLRHAHLTWTPAPTFVLLAGDASMDYKHRLATSGVDWIPTYLKFESIAGPQGAEQVAHDSQYSLNLSAVLPNDSDYVPSLFLARIPAGNATELDQFVSKVIAYENFQPTEDWRGRMLLLSDDEYSSGIFSAGSYCLNTTEGLFHDTNVDFSNAAILSQSGQDIRSDFFDLKTYTDLLNCPTGSDPNCRDLTCVYNAVHSPSGAADQFFQQLGPGALILNIESHANRSILMHERIYATIPVYGGPDYPRLTNVGRPALLMVWGCHANQFADSPFFYGSAFTLSDSSKAIGEEWLMLANRGSIASLGSSSFEFLNTNSSYNLDVADAFFTTPPVPTPPPGQPRRAQWILGEVMGQAAVENGLSPFSFQAVMNRTVNLLGDPMTRMDALPPRVFEVKLNGAVYADGASFTNDTPAGTSGDSVTVVAKVRDEASVASTTLAERDLASGVIATIDSTTYTTALSDSGRLLTLTARARPHIGNYDLQVRAIDGNGRLQVFALQVRTPIRYLANGTVIVNNVFVENEAILRAEITTPIPVTADSLELYLDGAPITVTKTQTDGAGRQWVLEGLREGRGPGSHTLQVAISGRTTGLDQVSYQVSTQFTMRGVAVVSPQVMGTGCGGSVFQYELSAPASKVELLLLTVAGRRVSSVPLTGNAGFNVYCWDGRDSQGHETAAGVYLYRIKATDATGRTVTQDGRMIRPR